MQELAVAVRSSQEEVSGAVEALVGRHFPLEVSSDGVVTLGPDTPIHAGELKESLRTRLVGRALEVYREVGSTQDVARKAVENGAEAGLVVVAEHQRGGRGRLGRRWLSRPGKDLLLSVVTFPPEGLRATALTITSAVAVCEAIAEVLELDARIRWPNDVLVEDAKVAGILVEGVSRPAHRRGEQGLVVGVGVNVNSAPADVPGVGSLAGKAGRELDRTVLLLPVLRGLDHWYEVLLRGHSDEVERHWRARSSILGRQVVLEHDGHRYRGRVVDLSVTEGIILELASGVTRLFPPEHVTLLPERE